MKFNLLTHSRWLPAAALLFFAPGSAPAQSSASYCEPSAALKEDLKQVEKVSDEDLPFRLRRDRQTLMLQELLKKYPGDFHVLRRYQDERRGSLFVDADVLLADYGAQMEKNPDDPGAVYRYVRLLVGRRTKQAIEQFEKLVQRAPVFPWSHLELAQIYNYPNFRDAGKSQAHLKQWISKCPTAMSGFWLVARIGDQQMMTEAAQRLRARLESSNSNEDLGYWNDLWSISFKLKPVPEHAQVRQQIAEDLKRLRAKNLNSKAWLSALQAGYKQAGDKEGRRWAEDELVRLFPKSETARRMVQTRWYDEHPYPKPEDSDEKKRAYHQAVVQITTEWLRQWPADENIWSARFYSLSELDQASNEEVKAAYDGYVKAHEQQEGYGYSIPPIEVAVARVYVKRGFSLESVPALLQKGLTEIERIERGHRGSDLYPREEGFEDSSLRYVQWESWPLLAEAYARLKQRDKAHEVLDQMANALKQEKPGEKTQPKSNTYNQLRYWQATAKVAEVEQRKLDALMAYQTALVFRPKSAIPKSADKDELTENAQRLWKELGGTEQGWQAYLARNEVLKGRPEAAEELNWNGKNVLLPDFDLTDLQSRKWKLADLKGKVAFVNLWATWCGPCRMELPYVQKLSEQMKDNKDVLILTINIDEEIGLIEPFMKENKYTFPVILGQAYAESQGVFSIPRNWVVSIDGKLTFEGTGFGNDGEEWMKKAIEMIRKVRGTN